MVMISLLNLPLELPPTSKAMIEGTETFLTGVPQYLSRCVLLALSPVATL